MGAMLPFMTKAMLPGVYDIARQECNPVSVVTNTTPDRRLPGGGASRGGRRRGADPRHLRRRDRRSTRPTSRRHNLIAKDAFPFTTPAGSTYDSGDYEQALDLALAPAGYEELRAEQAAPAGGGRPRRHGHRAGHLRGGDRRRRLQGVRVGGGTARTAAPRSAPARRPTGRATPPSWAMLVSDQTGIPVDRIRLIHGDTDLVPRGEGTMGSRSLQQGGVGRVRGHREPGRPGPPAGRQPARGQRRRHRGGHRRRPPPRGRVALGRADVGRAGRRRRGATGA